MSLLPRVWFRLRALFERDAMNAEFEAELRDHVERETAANVARGLNAAEARQKALAEFGGVERFKEELRDQRNVQWLHDIVGDLKHGARLLRLNLLFSTAIIGTLALGIGTTSTIFTIVNGVLLRTPSYEEPEKVISISESSRGIDRGIIGQSTFEGFRTDAQSVQTLAAYRAARLSFAGGGQPVEIKGVQATASLFDVLKTPAELGRVFTANEEVGAAPVIVLSHALWNGAFGGDSAIVGRTITMNDMQYKVVGVMPTTFATPIGAAFWIPRATPVAGAEQYFTVVARMRASVSVDSAKHELQSVAVRRAQALGDTASIPSIAVMTLRDRQYGPLRRPLSLLFAAVGVLLVVACINVANLTLARSVDRRREFAVRLALGGNRWRLTRQLCIENLLLVAIGGAAGAYMPMVLVGLITKLSPESLGGVSEIHVDGAVLLFIAATTLAVAVFFGSVSAVSATRTAPSHALLTSGSRESQSKSHGNFRSALVVFEIGAALLLLTGAGLVTKNFVQALSINPGFRAQRLYAVTVQLPLAYYPRNEARVAFYSEAAERAGHMKGVDGASVSDGLPLLGFGEPQMVTNTLDHGIREEVITANVASSFASVAGLEMVAGRFIENEDRDGTKEVAVVSASFARRFYPAGQPLGQLLPTSLARAGLRAKIVGIVADVREGAVEAEPRPQVYFAVSQTHESPRYLIVRTTLDKAILRDAFKRLVAGVDSTATVSGIVDMNVVLSQSYAPRRFNFLLMSTFAMFGLLLALVGLYGLMAHAVRARTLELGIRIAFGADTDNILRLVLRQGLKLTAVGIGAGLALSFLVAQTLGARFGVSTHDPLVFISAPIALALVSLAACYLPARRATRVDPMVALRA